MTDYSKIISDRMKKISTDEIIYCCPFDPRFDENHYWVPKFLGNFICRNICHATVRIDVKHWNVYICKLKNSCPCVSIGRAFGKERALNYALYPPVQLGD